MIFRVVYYSHNQITGGMAMDTISGLFGSIFSYSFLLIVFALTVIMPLILGVRNWYFTFRYPKMSEEERAAHKYYMVSVRKNDLAIVILGAVYSLIWITDCPLLLEFSPAHDYYEPCYVGQYHLYLHSEYDVTVWITLLLGFIGLIIIAASNAEKVPPIPQALSFAFALLGETVFLFLLIQLAKNNSILIIPPMYYLINAAFVTARNTKRYITEHLRYKQEHDTQYIHGSAQHVEKALSTVASLTELHFLMLLPAAVILIAIFIIIGQGPDGIIKAFTMTADWTFSTQVPPPPIDYEGHYLCTVAAGGHKKVVKPVRYGKRRGDTIVVNRQLLASNAFEDIIMERTPKFHKAIRGFYDKHGYPISRHITTQTRADIVYIIMKPLEWLFILFLYTFDTHPENRIAVQYSDYPKK